MENNTFENLKLAPQISKLDEKLLSNDLQHIVNKAFDSYSEKPYIVENKQLYRFCVGAAIFGGLLSICAAFLFVLNIFTQIIVGQIVSKVENVVLLVILGVLALAFLLVLEYAKSILISATAKDYQKKGKASVFAFLSLLVCLGFSAYTSIQGANSLAIINAQPSENEFIKVDSVGQTYDSQIKDLQAQIKAAKKNGSGYTWNGALTEKGRNYTERLNAQIMKLNDLKDKNVESSKQENNALISQASDKGTYNGAIVMLISAFIEILIISTIIYKERYEFVSLQEIGMLNKPNIQNSKDTKKQNNDNENNEIVTILDITTGANLGKQSIAAQQKKPNEIGFHTVVNRDKNDLTQVVNNDLQKQVVEPEKVPIQVVLNENTQPQKQVVLNDLNTQVVNNDLQKQVVLNDLQNAQNNDLLNAQNNEKKQVVLNDLNTQVVLNDLKEPLQPNEKNCLCCGKTFKVKNKIHKFCTDVCRYEYNEKLKGYKVFDIISKKKA
jgi:hypothetical protein